MSIPLIIVGSQLLMKVMGGPIIITLGAALLGFVAGEMLVHDAASERFFGEMGPTRRDGGRSGRCDRRRARGPLARAAAAGRRRRDGQHGPQRPAGRTAAQAWRSMAGMAGVAAEAAAQRARCRRRFGELAPERWRAVALSANPARRRQDDAAPGERAAAARPAT
ncbi:MAG: hypothetical protein U1F25_04625 [Rubrivivax sp.]